MTITSLEELKAAFEERCDAMGAGPQYRGWFRTSAAHDGSSHVELVGGAFHFVVTERGSEYERRETRDPDRVLYWLMSSIASDMALSYELRNRRPEEDFRRQYFAEQERLLRLLNPSWADEFKASTARILEEHPFVDPGAQT